MKSSASLPSSGNFTAATQGRDAKVPATSVASWHSLPASDVLQRLGSNASHGLSESEARERAATFGPNELARARSPGGIWRILWAVLVVSTIPFWSIELEKFLLRHRR